MEPQQGHILIRRGVYSNLGYADLCLAFLGAIQRQPLRLPQSVELVRLSAGHRSARIPGVRRRMDHRCLSLDSPAKQAPLAALPSTI